MHGTADQKSKKDFKTHILVLKSRTSCKIQLSDWVKRLEKNFYNTNQARDTLTMYFGDHKMTLHFLFQREFMLTYQRSVRR